MGELNAKLKALAFRVKKTDDVVEKQDREAAERQRSFLEAICNAVNTLKETVEEKFSKGETEDHKSEWAEEIDEALCSADESVRKLNDAIDRIDKEKKDAETMREHRQQMELEKEKQKQQQEADERVLKERLEFEKNKWELEMQFKEKQQHIPNGETGGAAKMPKLVISKFTGTVQDWLRFWSQFEAKIDKSDVPAVTMFSYLKELVETKVRNLIDGLPFIEEGYHRAIDLLRRRYGNTSEVVSSYVRNILQLSTIKDRDVRKIHEFYETLLFNVESLQTLKSLDKLDAAVSFTLEDSLETQDFNHQT